MRFVFAISSLMVLSCPVLAAQSRAAAVASERADFATWLRTSPISPYAAIYHQPFYDELVFGPDGDPILAALPPATLSQGRFRLSLHTADGRRTVPRNRDVPLGGWSIRVSGERRRGIVTVFGPARPADPPGWYPYREELVLEGTLERPEEPETRRMLGLDGVEVEGTLAGTFVVLLGSATVRLTVYRMPEPGSEESELNIFFRDGTNADGTYPAGRFLALEPLDGRRYRADFNRARNPFCAYNGIFPCPLPWPGNVIAARIEVGERYHGTETEIAR